MRGCAATTMVETSIHAVLSRLAQNQREDGGFSYSPTGAPAAEPTALAAIAFSDPTKDEQARAQRALNWLRLAQRPDGSVPVSTMLKSPAWTTSLAMLAWSAAPNRGDYRDAVHSASAWLIRNQGLASSVRLNEAQHDATIVGWSWVDGTHSWVEPTAYAVLALRSTGESEHTRTRDGIRLLHDRALPSGGWNYGNSTVLANTLRPFPETTGVALAALSALEKPDTIEKSLTFLEAELPRIRSPLALGWGLIGLGQWNRRPQASSQWLDEAVSDNQSRLPNAQHDALLLLAASDQPVFNLDIQNREAAR